MPRSARAAVAGQCYHLINRGNARTRVFASVAEYAAFVELIADAQRRIELDLFSVCVMPNHFHLLASPRRDEDLGAWMHWALSTHVRRLHRWRGSSGHIWQGRFKAFPVQHDGHYLAVLRYIERNALRAGLVSRAEEWRWGSLAWRLTASPPVQLRESLVPLPGDWVHHVNAPQSAEELDAIRQSVNRQRPYGEAAWVVQTAGRLGLEQSLRGVGRPRKPETGEMGTFLISHNESQPLRAADLGK